MIHFLKNDIFICMNKTKQLRIRITEEQFRNLADMLIEEQMTKSQIIREMIDDYVHNCRKTNKLNVQGIIKEINDFNNDIPNNKK